MDCPKCNRPNYHPNEPCSQCQFEGNAARIEELAHIRWILAEIDRWQWLGLTDRSRELVRQQYTSRQRQLEVELNLRLPPFSTVAARQAWPDLVQRERLQAAVGEWLAQGLIEPLTTQKMVDQTQQQATNLREQLEGHARPNYPATDADRLEIVDFILEAVEDLDQSHSFTTPEFKQCIQQPLLDEKEALEIKLGLRPEPQPVVMPEQPSKPERPPKQIQPASQTVRPPGPTPVPAFALAGPSPPASPASPPAITWGERLWRTLLSERTLQAMLFLGIFLLFSAAISFVAWGWQDFSAPMRVAIPTGFTAIFFSMGWTVRTKTSLYRSGIALSAIAALLIPIDFYTIYVNFNISAEFWPLFWLITSLFCLITYIIVTLIIKSRFFGYLVGVAAGSTVLALIQLGHQQLNLPLDWRPAGLSGLSLGLIMIATVCDRHPAAGRWRAFAEPFRYLSLLTVAVLMPLTFGWRFVDRDTYDALHYALMVTWWLGGFIFGWGAIFYRSHGLGMLAAIALPVATYLAQAALFDQSGIHPAWHAFGWAWLVPLYLLVGHKLLGQKEDRILYGHGRTATGWGVVLLLVAALWSLTDLGNGAAAASSHALLTAAVGLAALLWQRPRYLYGASLLSFSTATFVMTEMNLTAAQLSLGWSTLAIAHLIIALNAGVRFPIPVPNYAGPLALSGYVIAGLALLPPLYPYDGDLLVYAFGNGLGLAAWGARLAHLGQPGFVGRIGWRKTIFHWLTAGSLPVWLWLLFANSRPLDFSLPLALVALAWAMIVLAYRLARIDADYRASWYLTGGLVSLAAPIAAFSITPQGFTPAIVLTAVGLLYFADAFTGRQSGGLLPAGFVTAWGYLLFVNRLGWSLDAATFALTGLVLVYIGTGLWIERRRSILFTQQFLFPLYLTAHILTVIVLCLIYIRPLSDLLFEDTWTDTTRLWGAAGQLLLAVVYLLYAWGSYKERWAHLAAWLGAASGGFIAITYSTGRGSSAAKIALVTMAFILAERGLHRLRQHPALSSRRKAVARLSWRLVRRPLLAAGWLISAGVIALALFRNLLLLGGGRIQQLWAVVALLLILGLYTLSARLFRQARFMWLAAFLIVAPWTILTHLGWFTPFRPTLPGFALSWIVLAWLLFLTGLGLLRWIPLAYALPLKTVAHLLLPFSLLWSLVDVDTGRFTFGLAAGLYSLTAWLDHHRQINPTETFSLFKAVKFFYPALGLIPVWCLYLLAWLWPAARVEAYGLMLLIFGPLGLIAGWRLKRIAPTQKAATGYALPAYLTGYLSLIAGTLLVVDQPALLAQVLIYDALLMVISAWIFRNPNWGFPAVVLLPASLLISLHEAHVPDNRHGWWLIALAALFLATTWALRRARLTAYSTAPLTAGLTLIALSLPLSSQDQIGALWGYGCAALLYGLSAFWLRRPILLMPASALIVVPYAISLNRSALAPDYYGLALFPGALAALGAGWALDFRLGRFRDFPWGMPTRWPVALVHRLLHWWALPLYLLGFTLAMAGPIFTNVRPELSALNLLLLMPIFGWAIYRFRLRIWLVALVIAGHLAAILWLNGLGGWRYPAWAWLQFLPVTILTTLLALIVERTRHEGSPLDRDQSYSGWSHPLYALIALDIILAQLGSLEGTWAGATVTLIHLLLIAGLASLWRGNWLAYLSLGLSVVTVAQWGTIWHQPLERFPVALARLALLYGLLGYGLALRQARLRPWLAMWALPLQRFSMILAPAALILMSAWGFELIYWTLLAVFGFAYHSLVDASIVWMAIEVLALSGLLYLATAYRQRWLRLSYAALGMLLLSWTLLALFIQQWATLEQVQFYFIPVGLYLLAIATAEWQRGHKTLGRWLDYAALLLMMGTLFWQTLILGWGFALLLGGEGLVAFWWGSARRLRRFFYAGMVGVMLATLGQLINSLRSINQWIVFGTIGLLLVLVAIVIERKLAEIKLWQEKILESWE